jgi:hypothetical protein
MSYIDQSDYLPYIRDKILNQVIESTPAILDDAELTAISVVKDALHSNYNVADIFARTGTDRHPQVVRWCITLVLYFIYERIPDNQTPERIKTNYEITLQTLADIEDAKKSVDLPRLVVEGIKKTNFRWGSQPPRGHNT